MKKLRMNLADSSYDIIIEENGLYHLNEYLLNIYTNKNIYIITDTNVFPLYGHKLKRILTSFDVKFVIVDAGEKSKSFLTYQNVLQQLVDLNIRRDEMLIALGGGVVGDLTGFIAATLYRGLPFIQIPTSLLSQMDSSIGGKTGIDFYGRKNIVGAFKQPQFVLIDPTTLTTLPEIEFKSGMGELIKHACIGDKVLLEKLMLKPLITEEIIEASLKVKKGVVELDPFDKKERMYLNFGHTFGHIIELEQNLKHGIAVSKGMLMAIKFGIDLGITKVETFNKLMQILKIYDIDTSIPDYRQYVTKTIYDKKNLAGKLRFIFITDFGDVFSKEFSEEELVHGCINQTI